MVTSSPLAKSGEEAGIGGCKFAALVGGDLLGEPNKEGGGEGAVDDGVLPGGTGNGCIDQGAPISGGDEFEVDLMEAFGGPTAFHVELFFDLDAFVPNGLEFADGFSGAAAIGKAQGATVDGAHGFEAAQDEFAGAGFEVVGEGIEVRRWNDEAKGARTD
jgi:hypothetical protein